MRVDSGLQVNAQRNTGGFLQAFSQIGVLARASEWQNHVQLGQIAINR